MYAKLKKLKALFDETLAEIRNAALANVITIVFFLLYGSVFMMWIEGWNFDDAVLHLKHALVPHLIDTNTYITYKLTCLFEYTKGILV
jgi:hypothetical protein